MRAVLLFLAAGATALGQSQPLTPTAEFELNAGLKVRRLGSVVRSYLAVAPSGLTLITIGERAAAFSSSDLNGRILYSKSGLTPVNARADVALPCPDGSVWLVSSGPDNRLDSFVATDVGSALPPLAPSSRVSPSITSYKQLDLYSPAGERLASIRFLSPVPGSESPIAAAGNRLVLLRAPRAPQAQLIHFGTVTNNQFKEQTQVRLAPPVTGVISILASNSNLLLIDKTAGNIMVIDPNTKSSSIVRLDKPHPVRAATADSDYLYLLSADAVLIADLAGRVLSTFQLKFNRGFKPASLGVTGHSLYLVDNSGRAERFQFTAPTSASATHQKLRRQ